MDTYSVLEKIRVQIFVKSVFIFDRRPSPVDFISEWDTGALYKADFILTSEIYIDYLFSIVSNVELLVRPNEVIRGGLGVAGIWNHFPHNACNKKTKFIPSRSKTCGRNCKIKVHMLSLKWTKQPVVSY